MRAAFQSFNGRLQRSEAFRIAKYRTFRTESWAGNVPRFEVTSHDFPPTRLQRCQRQRRKLPNLVEVDSYRMGDLMRVVRVQNGIEPPARP